MRRRAIPSGRPCARKKVHVFQAIDDKETKGCLGKDFPEVSHKGGRLLPKQKEGKKTGQHGAENTDSNRKDSFHGIHTYSSFFEMVISSLFPRSGRRRVRRRKIRSILGSIKRFAWNRMRQRKEEKRPTKDAI